MLLDHPAVGEAVAGIPDARWGERPIALVVLAPGAEQPSEEELRAKAPGRVTCVHEPGPGRDRRRARSRAHGAGDPGHPRRFVYSSSGSPSTTKPWMQMMQMAKAPSAQNG